MPSKGGTEEGETQLIKPSKQTLMQCDGGERTPYVNAMALSHTWRRQSGTSRLTVCHCRRRGSGAVAVLFALDRRCQGQ